jgi:hypothetical protein
MKGFTIFFAMLVASLSLAIGLAVYDLTVRELDLSATATQSQYAIYAADAGAECVLFWDSKYPPGGFGSAFASTSASVPPTSGVTCLGQDIAAHGTAPTPFSPNTATWTSWVVDKPGNATTTFTLMLGNVATSSCAVVDVAKRIENGAVATTITSRGFNVCNADFTPRVERRFEVRY